jgi:DNA-binding transcriptional LysR family regulator
MSLAENWIPGILQGFSKSCPDIDVVIHGTVWESPGEPVADLSITINRDGEAPPGAARLWQERLMLVCAPALARRVTSPEDIATLPKIFVLGRQEYWTAMASALSLAHFDLDRGHKTNATNIALEMAASGLGLTVALASLTRTYVDRGLLVEPLAVRPESPWSYYMRASSMHRRAAVDRLRDWILSARPVAP